MESLEKGSRNLSRHGAGAAVAVTARNPTTDISMDFHIVRFF
jgi:hypothetical protein